MVSHLVKEYRDAQNGTKQDGTVALQHASDVLNIVTGDLAGVQLNCLLKEHMRQNERQKRGILLLRLVAMSHCQHAVVV